MKLMRRDNQNLKIHPMSKSSVFIRVSDLILSGLMCLLLMPFFIVIGVIIKVTSRGPVFYTQKRVGKNGKDFYLYKFRTMHVNADQIRSLTIGDRDPRLTKVGYLLRKLKLDELPQLFNVIKNDMSLVGPRPELRKYVDFYNEEQKNVLSVKPGITDYASIIFRHESRLLATKNNPEEHYINEILPVKLRLNNFYIKQPAINNYFYIIFSTIGTLFIDWRNFLKNGIRQKVSGVMSGASLAELNIIDHLKSSNQTAVKSEQPDSSLYAKKMIALAGKYFPENKYQKGVYSVGTFFGNSDNNAEHNKN